MVGGATTTGRSRPGANRRPSGCRDPALTAWSVRSHRYPRFDRIGRCACPWRSCRWRTCRRRGCSAASRFVSISRARAAPLVAAIARDGLTRGPQPEAARRWRRTWPARWCVDAAPCATPGIGCRRPRRSTARRRAGHPSDWCQAALVASLSLLCPSTDSSGVTLTLAAVRAGANRLSCPFRACGELTPEPGIRQACGVRDDEVRAVSGPRGCVPDGAVLRPSTRCGGHGVGWNPQWAVVPIPAEPARRHASWNV
jgi:hypothetical protein